MKMASAADIKANRASPHISPRVGSRTELLHRFFLGNRGRMVAYRVCHKDGQILERLRSTYGLDIQRANPPWRHYWILKGEWFGHRYVDYTANPSTEAVSRDWREWQLNPPASSEAA